MVKIFRKKRKSVSAGDNVPHAGDDDNKMSNAELEERLRETMNELLETKKRLQEAESKKISSAQNEDNENCIDVSIRNEHARMKDELVATQCTLLKAEERIETLLKKNGLNDELTETKSILAVTEKELLQAEAKIERLQNGKDGRDDKTFKLDTSDPWNAKYMELRDFLVMNGHCRVPVKYDENPSLGYWVYNQKANYRNSKTGKEGTKLTEERISMLEGLGFSWGKMYPAPISWDERYEELRKFQEATGHCDIHVRPENPSSLAKWVSAQRDEYWLLRKNKQSIISLDQVSKLNDIGFNWDGPRLS